MLSITAYLAKGCAACEDVLRDIAHAGLAVDDVVGIDEDANRAIRASITRVPYFTAHKEDALVGSKVGYLDAGDFADWRRAVSAVLPSG